MTRLQYNVCYSYLDGVLSDTATTAIPILNAFKEGGLAGTNIPTVTSPDILVLICEEEVIHVTSYVSGATSIATVLRGQEDTTAVEHPTGARIFNGPTKLDIDPVVALDADLEAIAALPSAANKLLYATGAQTWALTDLTPFARTLLDDANQASAKATLGITTSIGPMVVTIATADSPATLLARADYVCDGTADNVEIQAAVDYLGGGGGVIEFAPGTYDLTATVTIPAAVWPGVTHLRGSGLPTYIQRTALANFSLFSANASAKVVFENLSLVDDGGPNANTSPLFAPLSTSTSWTFRNCMVGNWQTGGDLVTLPGGAFGSKFFIYDSAFECDDTCFGGTPSVATVIEVHRSTFGGTNAINLAVVPGASTFSIVDSSTYGRVFISGDDASGPKPAVTIRGGKFTGNGSLNHVDLKDCSGVQIRDALFSGGALTRIKLDQVSDPANSGVSIISGNIFDLNTGHHGVWVLDSDRIVICDNTIKDCGNTTDNTYSGILLDGNTNGCFVHDNKVMTDGAGNLPLYGIRVDDATCDDNVIVNNDLRTSSKVVGNEFSDAGTGTVAGLEASALSGWFQDDVPASQTAVALTLSGGRTEIPMPADGYVVGVAVFSNEARTAGTLTVDPTINGTVVGLTAVLDGTNTTTKTTRQANGLDKFTAGQRIGVKITTDAGWLPTTADIDVTVLVVFNTANRV